MLPKIVEKLIKRLLDFVSEQKFQFTTSSARVIFEFGGQFKKGLGVIVPIWP